LNLNWREKELKVRRRNLETAAGAVDAAVVNNATLNEEHRDSPSAR
jgi:hypothetical protein